MCSGGGNCPPLIIYSWINPVGSGAAGPCGGWGIAAGASDHAGAAGQFWDYTTPQPHQPGWWQRKCVIVYPKHTANFVVLNPNRQQHIYLNLQLTAEKGLPLLILEPNPVICFLKWVFSTTSLWWDHETSGMKRIFATKLTLIKKKPNLGSHSKALILTADPNYAPSES